LVGNSSIPLPHGGRLVNRIVTRDIDESIYTIQVSGDLRNDIENIADGVFSPLEGFLGQEDFESVVRSGRLKSGLAWTVPIVLDVDEENSLRMKDSGEVALATGGDRFATLKVEEVYSFGKLDSARQIYGTDDTKHPGVEKMVNMKSMLVGGKLHVARRIADSPLRKHRKTPAQTREEITSKGWRTTVGFQTRNVPHVAHEMLQKAALNLFDGLLLNPLIGKKKQGDFKDEVILAAYEALISNYYPQDRAMFVTLHTEMRYAGPKEAIHHAIMRKNFGCSHFIVGRDHAGVGSYYHPFAPMRYSRNIQTWKSNRYSSPRSTFAENA
jgi:sulfate adenylyltransferase